MRHLLLSSLAAAAITIGMSGAAQALPITKQVTIRPIQLCDEFYANCAPVVTYEAAADKIWAQAGIDFAFLPTVQWNKPEFQIIDAEAASVVGVTPAVGQEFAMMFAGSAAFGDPAGTGVINMYFVEDFLVTGGTLYGEGCGAPVFAPYCYGQSGVVINGPAVNAYNGGLGRIDTVGHEVGHVLGLTHDGFGAGGADNFMTTGNSRSPAVSLADINPDGLGLDKMTNAQATEALSSFYVKDLEAVPEPASMMVLAVGLAGLGLYRRRCG